MDDREKVVKTFKFKEKDTIQNNKTVIVSVIIDCEQYCVRIIKISGISLNLNKLFYGLLADKDFRRMINMYQQNIMNDAEQKVCVSDNDGQVDILITDGENVRILKKEHIKRICDFCSFENSMTEKMDKIWIHVSDFLEMCTSLGIDPNMSRVYFRKKARIEYVNLSWTSKMFKK